MKIRFPTWPVRYDVLAIAVFTTTIEIAALAYFYPRSLQNADFDGVANLNIARFLTDSLTPGFSQIGVWNVLNHMILAPAAYFDFLYFTGLAGFVTHLPLFFLGAVFMYGLCMELTENRFASFAGMFVFASNPYVLQMYASPMSEPAFFTLIAGVALWVAQWVRTKEVHRLLLAAFIIAVACVARFEAFAMVPVGLVAVMFMAAWWRYSMRQSLSVALMFFMLSVSGALFVLSYSWFYTGNPLYFVTYQPAGQAETVSEVRGSVGLIDWDRARLLTVTLWGIAIAYFPLPAVMVAVLGWCRGIVQARRLEFLTVVAFLLAPTLFIIAAYVMNTRSFYIPPYSPLYRNVRYLLHTVVLLSLLTACGVQAFLSSKRMALRALGYAVGALVFFSAIFHTGRVFFVSDFPVVKINFAYNPDFRGYSVIRSVYDHGKILMSHANNETVMFNSYLHLDNVIQESNYRYFEQALREPWLFARWVVLNKEGATRDQLSYQIFKWVPRDLFNRYYELVLQGDRSVYRLREDVVREAAQSLGYDPFMLPSLNPEATWDPATFYQTLQQRAGR